MSAREHEFTGADVPSCIAVREERTNARGLGEHGYQQDREEDVR